MSNKKKQLFFILFVFFFLWWGGGEVGDSETGGAGVCGVGGGSLCKCFFSQKIQI